MSSNILARRQFVKFLAASPLFAALSPGQLLAATPSSVSSGKPGSLVDSLFALITIPDQALDVFDFERVAERVLPPAHWGYMATGTDGDESLHANRTSFEKVYLRALRMVDTSNIDTGLELLGEALSSPIVIAPVGVSGRSTRKVNWPLRVQQAHVTTCRFCQTSRPPR